MNYAKCEANWVRISLDTDQPNEQIHLIRDMQGWQDFLKGLSKTHREQGLMCSSSLDWPRDYTDKWDVIQVCNAIRGNYVR